VRFARALGEWPAAARLPVAAWLGAALLLSAAVMLPLRPAVAGDPFPVPRIPDEPRHYVCGRVQESPRIDGALDDAAWEGAAWTDPFVDIEGPLRPAPRFATRVKMVWGERAFYIAASMEEPDLWATYAQRDAVIYHENDFEVFIDPDGDAHEYYELELNVLNTVWDLLLIRPYRDGGPAVNGWDIAGLRTAVQADGTVNDPSDRDRGWSVEIALPWPALAECAHRPAPPGDGDQWRLNFSRVEWRRDAVDGGYVKQTDPQSGRPLPEDNWVWSPQGLIAMHYPERWGIVQFSTLPPASGDAGFRIDPDAGIRAALWRVYYHEKDRQQREGRFASEVPGLELDPASLPFPRSVDPAARLRIDLRLTQSGFEATAPASGGATLHIRDDGRLWKSHP
jgi:hypothetical protein